MATRIGLWLACGLVLAGCASSTAYRVTRSDVIGPCGTAVPDRDVLVGVALSGGGSRAALFGAAAMEALAGVRTADGASVIEKISHLSSVSGGSIAATYYALKKPGREVKVLNADGTLSEAYRAFFEKYRTELSQDFETSLIWRQLLSFRWLNSALAARTLAEIVGERLYGAARLQDLSARRRPATARDSSSTPRSTTTAAASL
jgi:predicted acylesterase/phospholipase RssA